MRNRTIETAATAIVVASLIYGLVATMPTTPNFGEIYASAEIDHQYPNRAFGLRKQAERI